jgi:Uma2 family endonuclease
VSCKGTPTWEIAHLYPPQGSWSEEQYLALDTPQLIEFKDGWLEFLPMTHPFHQDIAQYLFLELHRHVSSLRLGGRVYLAPLRTRTIPGFIREPDVVYVAREQIEDPKRPVLGAKLVMEVVSEGRASRERDLVEKRAEYAAAKIPEYWIVDPENRAILVLVLNGSDYQAHGEFRDGETATSRLLPGFSVDVSDCFNSADLDSEETGAR